MRLWRLSGHDFARVFDGGYGLRFDGRWNTVGHATTYVSTSPSLCVLEKLVHVEDPSLLPALDMVEYEVPDTAPVMRLTLDDLPGTGAGGNQKRRGSAINGSPASKPLCS